MSPVAYDDQEELMVVAAWMYYYDGLTHAQIAKKLGISRVKVTRLLQKARREGVVQFRITKPLPLQYDLVRRLKKSFVLKDAIIVKTHRFPEETLDAVGQAGAEHLRGVLFPNCRLGMGWSTTVSRMAPYLDLPKAHMSCTVHELAGSMLGHANPYSISWLIAQTLNVPLEAVPVPVIVESAEVREAILREPRIRAALEHARQCDIAYVGVGNVGPDSTLVRTGLLTQDQMLELQKRGAVGDILMRFYDVNGKHISTDFDSRIISLEWDDIRNIPYVVVIAAGPSKVEPLLGALRGGVCDCVITDTETAQSLLKRSGGKGE